MTYKKTVDTKPAAPSRFTSEAIPAVEEAAVESKPERATPKTPRKAKPMPPTSDDIKPGSTHAETLRRGIKSALALETQWRASGVHGHEEQLKGLIKHLEDAAKAGGEKAAEAGKLANLVHALNDHLDEIRDHHAGDAKFAKRAKDIVDDFNVALSKFATDDKGLIEALETRFKTNGIAIPGTLVRSADIPMHKEYAAQVAEHFGPRKTIFGKAMSVVGGTVSLGVIAHGGMNIKRGLFGYQDPESGEHKGGALSTLIVGAVELAAGLAGLKKSLTGRWSGGRAVHERAHHHDHDHGHHHH